MQRLAVINMVGLTRDHLGEHTPYITALAEQGSVCNLDPPFPAVTSTVQTTLLTGLVPKEHGIVSNGWHERETNSTHFWRQSNSLVQGEMIWDAAKQRNSEFTCANMFWWFNMYSSVDIAVTPRPIYCADGRKIPDIWTNPENLRSHLQSKLGQFPLFKFWGPAANIESSRWIVDATILVEQLHEPTLTLVYVPHLDYALQKFGPHHPSISKELRAVDTEVGKLIEHFTKRNVNVCVLSEYGIDEVEDAVALNRVLRHAGLLEVRNELGREYLDAGLSDAFAVPDHQVAHVYVKNHHRISETASLLREIRGVEHVYTGTERGELAHERCGEIVVVADTRHWFSHDWWEHSNSAPDYQQTVDIHAKPGYDPRELLLAKGWRGSKARIALKLLAKFAGFKTQFDVVSLDTSRIRGSHGRTSAMCAKSPIILLPKNGGSQEDVIPATSMKNLFLDWLELS